MKITRNDIGRTGRTRDGRRIRIYAVDGASTFPIHGAIKREFGWDADVWTTDGKWLDMDSPDDIISLDPVKKAKVKR